ncbi:MAG: ABC transporter permease [Bacteroidales bacterium]|nr:ABC transporter permease [Bacteroidales bacterium]
MFRNYLRSLYRNIIRNKFYTVLNITGLSVGLASALFILFYVRDELTYDRHHVRHDRIYRIESDYSINNVHDMFAIVPIPMGPALKLEFPEVEEFVRMTDVGNALFRYLDREYYEEGFWMADSTMFRVFTHEFLMGDPGRCLTEPYSMVLTEKMMRKYFRDEDPMGKIITSGSGSQYKVTGVIRDLPGNSHLKFDGLISASTMAERRGVERFNSMEPGNFWNIGVFTFLMLRENALMESVHSKFAGFYEKYMKPVGDQVNGTFSLMSTPLARTHFRQGLSAELPTGNVAYIYIFSAVGVFILLIAVINYMNMATARSAGRSREVGVRKVIGAHRGMLIRQFIGESLFMALIAMCIAILLVILFVPEFNSLSGKQINTALSQNPEIYAGLLLLTLLTGFLSGSYPALYLSSFDPVAVLKGSRSGTARSGGMLRRILVFVQFFIAILMIIATISVSNQLNFLRRTDLGFDSQNLVALEMQDTTFRKKAEPFRNELLLNPAILSASSTSGVPGRIQWIQVVRVEKEEGMDEFTMIINQSDFHLVDLLGLEIIKGRNLDRLMGTDSEEALLINETAMKTLGWEDDPIGKRIQHNFEIDGSGGRMMKVVGVFRDFHFKSLHNKVEPMIMFIAHDPGFFMLCRIDGSRKQEALEHMGKTWTGFGANRPFHYEFITDVYDNMYASEKNLGRLFSIATLLAIFIALLGLLGLSSFITEQRTKEVGIRKVLGAGVPDILYLFYREFALLILIAFVVAAPVAWWRLDIWLKDTFVYHIPPQWQAFVAAGLAALVIGLGAVSYYIVRAASGNPVNAIKYE